MDHTEWHTVVVFGKQAENVGRYCRKGKQLWLHLEGGPVVLLHFGMTGSIVIRGVAAFRYKEFVVHDETWPPKSRCRRFGGVFPHVRRRSWAFHSVQVDRRHRCLPFAIPRVQDIAALVLGGADSGL